MCLGVRRVRFRRGRHAEDRQCERHRLHPVDLSVFLRLHVRDQNTGVRVQRRQDPRVAVHADPFLLDADVPRTRPADAGLARRIDPPDRGAGQVHSRHFGVVAVVPVGPERVRAEIRFRGRAVREHRELPLPGRHGRLQPVLFRVLRDRTDDRSVQRVQHNGILHTIDLFVILFPHPVRDMHSGLCECWIRVQIVRR